MKATNRFLRASTGILLSASLFAPSIASAQVASSTKQIRAAFCATVTDHVTQFEQTWAALHSKLETKRDERKTSLERKRADRQEQIDKKLMQVDERRGERIAKLQLSASTDAQKTAITNFQAAVSAAVSIHRSSIQTANKTFRQGLESAIAVRKIQTDAALAAFTESVRAAIAKAKTDCASSATPVTIRATLVASIKVAREKFQADRQDLDRQGQTVKTLVETRRASLEKAKLDFRTAIEKARVDLKAAFAETNP